MQLMNEYLQNIKNKFKGQTVYVIGSGPSLVGFDYSFFKNKKCIVVNSAYLHFKKAGINYDGHVFMDKRFLTHVVQKDFSKLKNVYTSFKNVQYLNKLGEEHSFISFVNSDKFIRHPGPVFHHNSSLACAVSIALQGMASEVMIYGADGRFVQKAEYLRYAKKNKASKEVIDEIEKSETELFSHAEPDRVAPSQYEPYYINNENYLKAFPQNKIKKVGILLTDREKESSTDEKENTDI